MSQAVIDQNAAASITGLLLPLTDMLHLKETDPCE